MKPILRLHIDMSASQHFLLRTLTEHVYCKPQNNVLCPDNDFDGNDSEVACEDSDEFLKVLH